MRILQGLQATLFRNLSKRKLRLRAWFWSNRWGRFRLIVDRRRPAWCFYGSGVSIPRAHLRLGCWSLSFFVCLYAAHYLFSAIKLAILINKECRIGWNLFCPSAFLLWFSGFNQRVCSVDKRGLRAICARRVICPDEARSEVGLRPLSVELVFAAQSLLLPSPLTRTGPREGKERLPVNRRMSVIGVA